MSVIPMNQSESGTSLSASRLVWVLNRDPVFEYKARYRGDLVTIPKNMEKIPKTTGQGGNLMPYMEACRFVRDLVEPQGYEMDAAGKPQPVFRNKMLLEQELTAEEFIQITGKAIDQKKERAREERDARDKLNRNLNKVSNKVKVEDEDE